jgi:hypothetical protein
MGKGGKKGKTYMKASRKAAALPVKGTNSNYMTKGKLATEPQECSCQKQQVMEVTTPTKLLPPTRESISDATRVAARERLKADQERQARNEEWRCLHELGSPVEYDHSLNRATQLVSGDKTRDNNVLLTLEWSEDTKSKMQTEALYKKEKMESMGKPLHSNWK